MAGRLRKSQARPTYLVSGTLEGVVPGRRVVKELGVSNLGSESKGGLEPLAGFPDLELLELHRLKGVDLSPLAALPPGMAALEFHDLRAVDLTPLRKLPALRRLTVIDVADDCRVPERLELPASLESLVIINDSSRTSGQPIKAILEAITWDNLAGLQTLIIAAGGITQMAPLEVDLAFLTLLPKLRRLDVFGGIWHKGPKPSPLEPPFEGLTPALEMPRFESWHPERDAAAFIERFGTQPAVYQRYAPTPDAKSWTLREDESEPGRWHTYGSLYDAFDGQAGEVEYDALREARRRLKAADQKLLARLDFDQESSGTGIAAPSKTDLERALQILDIV